MTRSLASTNFCCKNSFCDLTPPIESQMKENTAKNAFGQNEVTDFEKFNLEHPENPKTIFATNWLNHPGDGITLRQKLDESFVNMKRGRRKALKSRQRSNFMNLEASAARRRHFLKICLHFKFRPTMTRSLASTNFCCTNSFAI